MADETYTVVGTSCDHRADSVRTHVGASDRGGTVCTAAFTVHVP